MQLDVHAHEAESLLQAKYHFFEHPATGKTTIGCDEYHVHEDVKRHIDYITPGIKLYATRSPKPSSGDLEKRTFAQPPLLKALPEALDELLLLPLLALCDIAITPDCIMAMYNITEATTAEAGNELGIFEDLGDYYSQTDLNLFFLTLQNRIPVGTAPTLKGIE